MGSAAVGRMFPVNPGTIRKQSEAPSRPSGAAAGRQPDAASQGQGQANGSSGGGRGGVSGAP